MYNNKEQKSYRQSLRNNPSPPEVLLWAHIKGGALGAKFRRQYGIGSYVVDFYCPSQRLAIEVDGEHHTESPEVIEKDRERQRYIEAQNIRVLRFTSKEVNEQRETVLNEIMRHLT